MYNSPLTVNPSDIISNVSLEWCGERQYFDSGNSQQNRNPAPGRKLQETDKTTFTHKTWKKDVPFCTCAML